LSADLLPTLVHSQKIFDASLPSSRPGRHQDGNINISPIIPSPSHHPVPVAPNQEKWVVCVVCRSSVNSSTFPKNYLMHLSHHPVPVAIMMAISLPSSRPGRDQDHPVPASLPSSHPSCPKPNKVSRHLV
jgi:hypothetical protein